MNKSFINTAGWDIGGAHLKAAFIENNRLKVYQWACPLWRGISELSSLLEEKMKNIPEQVELHHVTMTGELVDCFVNRDQGVREIIHAFQEYANRDSVKYYSRQGYLTDLQALDKTDAVASVNWIASANAVSKYMDKAIFIDMGSTTTDVLKIVNNKLILNEVTDFGRLKSGELIYTGIVRSCVNTISNEVTFQQQAVPLVAENFACMADVYRILELLPDQADKGPTMDGQAKDKLSSLRRLARMIGKDYSEQEHDAWLALAKYLYDRQKKKIINQLNNIQLDYPDIRTIVAAGVGKFVAKQIADQLDYTYQEFADVVVPDSIEFDEMVSDCAPAVALVFT